ncbi:MAG: hypothetical protein JXC85_05765 [Candidatus Aenigmarchaeota archaeon]|nr:hypothetical protein [Candidatus Aenigmarchaeota archaeon]
MRAQAAFEYMLIVIIALAFMVPAWTYITSVKTEASEELALSYAKSSVDRLASTADLIYSQGPPAKVKVHVYIPDGVEGYNFTNKTVALFVRYRNTVTPVYADSKASLNGTLPLVEGNYWMQVEAVENDNYDVFVQAV